MALFGKWKILSGRISWDVNKSQVPKIHVPETMPPEYERFRYHVTKYQGSFAEKFPWLTVEQMPTQLSVFDMKDDTDLIHPLCPKSAFDYEMDTPLFHIHVVHFEDVKKSMLTVSFPHAFMDAGGIVKVMAGFVYATEGLANELPEIPCGEDPFKAIAERVGYNPFYKSPNHVIYTFSKIRMFFLKEEIKQRLGAYETRLLHFPPSMIKRLKEQTIQEFRNSNVDTNVSSNDVLCAWLFKMAATLYPKRKDPKFSLAFPVDLRQKNRAKIPETYLHNAIRKATTNPLPISTVRNLPLSKIAAAIRQVTNQYSEPCDEELAWIHQNQLVPGNLVCLPFMETKYFIVSNITSFTMGNRFKGAAKEGQHEDADKVIWMTEDTTPSSYGATIVSSTKEGGMLVRLTMRKSHWKRLKNNLDWFEHNL
ncbi:hypothetical protein BKA69DRAFT_1050473 [Paraphysoderma sedebokerense]|nr:hypothetical protein BKA69DRAFT_1050473 [Paraphysoderma sedebokerense]